MQDEEIDKILANVDATLAVEGLKTSPEGRQISVEYLRDKLTSEEAIGKIKLLH